MLPAPAGTGRPEHHRTESTMAKGLNQKKTEKKKPEKTLKEKRAEKQSKKAGKA
jgi:hypothetical protein